MPDKQGRAAGFVVGGEDDEDFERHLRAKLGQTEGDHEFTRFRVRTEPRFRRELAVVVSREAERSAILSGFLENVLF